MDSAAAGGNHSQNALTPFNNDFEVAFGFIGQALGITLLWIISCLLFFRDDFPGHNQANGWPLFVPDHFGGRNSQHLLDPYR